MAKIYSKAQTFNLMWSNRPCGWTAVISKVNCAHRKL